jgi:hypothetical protein
MFERIMKPVEILGACVEGMLEKLINNLPEIKFL